MHDPIDLLQPAPAALDSELKRRVFDASVGELRTQRRRQRQRSVVALVFALAAGLMLFTLIPSAPQGKRARAERDDRPVRKFTSAVAIEWQALDRPEESKQLYLLAGDRYLKEDDHAGAIRSYGSALDAGTSEELEVSADDDWLLMAIKLARKKEND